MWYKGNLHCHTTDSDGDCTPEEVVKRYKEQGYSFLAITDHNVYSDYREKFQEQYFFWFFLELRWRQPSWMRIKFFVPHTI